MVTFVLVGVGTRVVQVAVVLERFNPVLPTPAANPLVWYPTSLIFMRNSRERVLSFVLRSGRTLPVDGTELKDAIIDDALNQVRSAGHDPAAAPALLCEEIIREVNYLTGRMPSSDMRALLSGLLADDVLGRLLLRAEDLGLQDPPSMKRIH